MNNCFECPFAIFDYEEYYGGGREKIVTGCKCDLDFETCGEEEAEDG